ncbi:hypothetical protein UPYG_G00229770 [Umbra pygmaea]|uniref:EGF-like domain-containing protein n=1 Tax=Umbra pygmaea TaxID=75934 RepID=A0ABD0WE35_UMBPY
MCLTFFFFLVFSVDIIKAFECSTGCNPENGYCEKPGECRCRPGWNGETCRQCLLFPGCVHGSCERAWQCICEEGWIGKQCDQEQAKPCSSQQCAGNFTCIQTDRGGYLCICPPGYTGEGCRRKKGPCLTNDSPCQNGGTCNDANGLAAYPSCTCPAGFAGDFCEIDIESCDPNPCANGGNCTDQGATFTCTCPAGFEGLTCNITDGDAISPCGSAPCGNGGTCVRGNQTSEAGTYHCLCLPGFSFAGHGCTPNQPPHKPKTKLKTAKLSSRGLSPQHYTLPAHSFHKLLSPPERDKITLKETSHTPSAAGLITRSQVICFGMLGLLTCLVILGTLGIVFFNRCEMWMANARYSQLVHQQKRHLLRAGEDEGGLSVNVILPEKIKLASFGKHYTSI